MPIASPDAQHPEERSGVVDIGPAFSFMAGRGSGSCLGHRPDARLLISTGSPTLYKLSGVSGQRGADLRLTLRIVTGGTVAGPEPERHATLDL